MRYDVGVRIGGGGMGEVWKAWDPTLERYVALKVLHRTDPASVERMLREARSQARIEHPNVCQVYETGEDARGPFIAMQHVDGAPLDEALAGRPVEERVRVLATVAEAVQAAHQVGLVHRDLKPANILVEEDDDGRLVPYVVDFGIAREGETPGMTVTGEVIGTPGYMSPEQARGETRTLDRRSDVFSLGIVLYEELAGTHPFGGGSSLAAVARILDEQPTPLDEAAPRLPRDLRTIVGRCLEHDPDRRYPSARALAEDLHRYLAGEPIRARPATVAYRLARAVRRHPWTAAAIAAAILVTVLGTTAVVLQRRAAAERALLAERFGRRVERMQSSMRLAHLAPAHPLAAERRLVEAEMAAIERETAALGPRAAAVGAYALGRGAASLGRWQEARDHLERARDLGLRSPEASFALGRVLLELYGERLAEIAGMRYEEAREAESALARRELGDPARELLADVDPESLGLGLQGTAYLEALRALADGDLVQAATLADAARDGARSWFYEPTVVAADVAARQAFAALAASELDAAASALDATRRLLAAARETAPSDPGLPTRLCGLGIVGLLLDHERGEAPEAAYAWGRQACEAALALSPDHLPALVARAELGWRMGDLAIDAGRDPEPYLVPAEEAARAVLAVEPEHVRALLHRGNVEWVRAFRARDLGQDPRPALERAIGHLSAAEAIAPGDGLLLISLGNAHQIVGDYEDRVGGAPMPAWNAALAAFRRGLENPRGVAHRILSSLCGTGASIGFHLANRDDDGALPVLEDAERSCETALGESPGYLNARGNLVLVRWTLADFLARRGDGTAAFERTAAACRPLVAADPTRLTNRLNCSHVLAQLALERLDEGETVDPRILDESEELLAPIAASWPADHLYVATRLALARARLAAREGEAATARRHFADATRHARELVRDFPNEGIYHQLAAHALRRAATYRHAAGDDPAAARRLAREGLDAAERALAIDPGLRDASDERERLTALLDAGAAAAG